jgi:gliding motility-associated-like protein
MYVSDVQKDFVLKLSVEDEKFCRASDDIQVFVIKDYNMHVPTGFSPNGDGYNELLNVFGPEYGFIKEFNVFLRNGTNIYNEYNFKPNDIKIGWDGTFRNKVMPAGIYIWTMHVEFDDGARESFKGSVQLIR